MPAFLPNSIRMMVFAAFVLASGLPGVECECGDGEHHQFCPQLAARICEPVAALLAPALLAPVKPHGCPCCSKPVSPGRSDGRPSGGACRLTAANPHWNALKRVEVDSAPPLAAWLASAVIDVRSVDVSIVDFKSWSERRPSDPISTGTVRLNV